MEKQELIQDAILYMEEHLEEKIDFEEISRNLFLSLSYFRATFKSATGFRPTEYLNRMRILKSLEYLEDESCSVADAAALVGIYDSNYYSRVFKKVLGYSPKNFRMSKVS